MKRFHWRIGASIGEIILWLLMVSLAVLLGSAMERWTLRKAHKANPGTAEKGAIRGAVNGDSIRHDSKGFLEDLAPTAGTSAKTAFTSYGKIPLSFEPNQGQAAEPIRYLSRNNNQCVYLKSDEVILALSIPESSGGKGPKTFQLVHGFFPARTGPEDKPASSGFASRSLEAWTQLRMKFAGANPNVEIYGEQKLSRKSNYLIGADPRTWRENIPNYSRVHYSNLYPGVDLVFYGNRQLLEYDLVVKPGADLRQVRLSLNLVLDGSGPRLRIEPQTGDLVFQTPGGEIRQKRPQAYQEVNGKKEGIACRYALDRNGQLGFDVDKYDSGNPLIIDPVLAYSAVGIGGNVIAVDPSGSAYVAGVAGAGFMTTSGAFQSSPGGGNCVSGPNTVPCADILVAKLNSAGSDLVYATFLGGNGADYSYGLAVDGSGNVYLAGTTSSTNFPTTPGTFQTGPSACATGTGCYSAFVSKLNSNGTQLIYSTYLSGNSGGISANGVAVDPAGFAYVTGDSSNGGFITKLNADGSAPVYSTSGVGGAGIAVDLSGNAYLVGRQGGHSYVSKVSADGNTVMYNYRLGGSFPQFSVAPEELEGITGVAVDPQGYAYVTGYTAYSDFPTTPNAPFPLAQGVGNCGPSICRDAFVSKINTDGTGLIYSSYLGGSSVDYGTGIAVDLSGSAYVTGVTRSPDFPLIPGNVSGQKGGIFVSKMNAAGDAFLYSLTLGTGQTAESGNAIAADSKGNAYVTGLAGSDFLVTPASYQPSVGGNGSFVAKVFDEITLFVPVVLSTAGQNGSFFSSELALTNRGGSDSEVEYTYTAAIGAGSGVTTDRLPAGRQLIIPDTIAYLRGLGLSLGEGENLGGTLRVRFLGLGSPSEGAAIVRTTTAVPTGRAGLAYAGVLRALDEPSYLCGLRQNTYDRCNLAMQNAGTNLEGNITLRLEIFPSEPSVTSGFSPVVLEESLVPGEFKQISGILGQGGSPISNGFVRVSRIQGTAPYYAYAVINDQASSDGSFISPLAASSLAGRKGLVLPVVVESPSYSTELVITNYSISTKKLELDFVADGVQTESNSVHLSLVMRPHEQEILTGFVDWLRQQGVTGLPPGQAYAGPLFVTVEDGDVDGIFVGARTSTIGVGGRYGVFYAAVPSGTTSTQSTWLYDFQQSATTRTNLGLVNTGEVDGTPDVLKVEIYDGDHGQLVGTLEKPVNARRLLQISSLLEQYAPGTHQGYVRVTRTKGANPFIAFSVINDGARPREGSGDGAFVSSLP